jgi:kynureninase
MSNPSPTEHSPAALDQADPLRSYRERFYIPESNGIEQLYFCGNSLGLQPKSVRSALQQELDDWARLGVEGHFHAKHPWMPYHTELREMLAAVVGAKPIEVVAMNSLTVNLHLLMVSFYRPHSQRSAIIIEQGAFPSDRYAVESQIRFHGHDPADCLIEIPSDPETGLIAVDSLKDILATHGHRTALILWPGVQYRTGQAFDLKEIVDLGHFNGCTVGFDLAHAAGNLPLNLHDSGADFAAWCSYKYLNAGPGSIAGAFVHERHALANLPRFNGWWGQRQESRFKMEPEFNGTPGAEGWQLSNPPIFAMAPLRASLELFHEVGMPALRRKSVLLTKYLEHLIEQRLSGVLRSITPPNSEQRGCQLSLQVLAGHETGRSLFNYLTLNGVIGDWREPDVIRLSPAPLYNRFSDCFDAVRIIEQWARNHG